MSLPGGIEKVDRILQGKGLSYKTFSLEPPVEGVDVIRKFNKIVRRNLNHNNITSIIYIHITRTLRKSSNPGTQVFSYRS